MSQIVKICKVHGELTIKKCYIRDFNAFRCKECRKKQSRDQYFKNKQGGSFVKKRTASRKKWRKNNPESAKEDTLSLKDYYVKNLLRTKGFLRNEINEDLIEFKRSIVQLKRKIKEIKNEQKSIN
jgi:hypothetical protein